MKEKRLKGVITSSLLGLVFLAFSVLIGFFQWSSTNMDKLLKDGNIYGSGSGQHQVLQVAYIYPEIIGEVEGSSNLYLVGYVTAENTPAYVGLEAKAGDKEVEALLSMSEEDLANSPQNLLIKTVAVSEDSAIIDYSQYLTELIPADTEVGQSLNYLGYTSRLDLGGGIVTYIIMVAMFALGIFFLFGAWKIKQSNAAVYDTLYQTYPDLQGNLQRLVEDASYKDEKIGILIYKNHLLGYKQELFLQDLHKATQIYHQIVSHKKYGFITVARTSNLVITAHDNEKEQSRAIKNVGKKTDDQLQPFFNYLEQHFPDINLGVQE